jgi:two-component sensor histidine kinase
MNIDITEARRASEHRELLLDELNHRVKNTLAVVQSIAMHTQRSVESQERFSEVFAGRLQALARAHDLLTAEKWDGTWLADVVRTALSPYCGGRAEAPQVSVEGPGVRLAPMVAVSLSMAFHELATNAAKYGALSNDSGRLQVAWRSEGSSPPVILLEWIERDGPVVVAPRRRGFGSRLIERNVPIELGGRACLEFAPAGVHCRLWLPLSPKVSLT